MISVADCWSRMFSRLVFVANEELVDESTAKRIRNGTRMPAPRRRAYVIRGAGAGARLLPRGRSCECCCQHPSLRQLLSPELRDDPAAAHDEHPVRQAKHLF